MMVLQIPSSHRSSHLSQTNSGHMGVHIRALRFRLFSIFFTSIATTLASLARAILVLVGRQSLVWWPSIPCDVPNLQLTTDVFSSFTGSVSVAVATILCNMSVIIPAILHALGVGDPFMQEDTVDSNYSAIEMARMTSTSRSSSVFRQPVAGRSRTAMSPFVRSFVIHVRRSGPLVYALLFDL